MWLFDIDPSHIYCVSDGKKNVKAADVVETFVYWRLYHTVTDMAIKTHKHITSSEH